MKKRHLEKDTEQPQHSTTMMETLSDEEENKRKIAKIVLDNNHVCASSPYSSTLSSEEGHVVIRLDEHFSSGILRQSYLERAKQFHYYYCLLRFSKHFPHVIKLLEEDLIREMMLNRSNKFICKEEVIIRKFIEWAVEQNGFCINYLGEKNQKDKELLRKSLKTHPITALDSGIIFEHKDYLQMLSNKFDVYSKLPKEFKLDREITLEAVKHNGLVLEHVDQRFQNDREIVLAAVRDCGRALCYCSEELKRDREVALTAIKTNASSLYMVQYYFGKDREIIKEAIKLDGSCIRYADPSLLNDREFVLELIKLDNDGVVFTQLDPNFLQSDREILIEAIKKNPDAFKYADEKLKNNRELLLESFSSPIINCRPFLNLEHLRSDKEIMLKYLKMNRNGLVEADKSLLNSRDFILEAVKVRGSALLNVTNQSILEDEEIVREALKTEPNIFMYMKPKFLSNKEFARMAIKSYPNAFKKVDKSISNDAEFVLEIIKDHPQLGQYTDLRMNDDFLVKAARVNLKSLRYMTFNFSKELLLRIFENVNVC